MEYARERESASDYGGFREKSEQVWVFTPLWELHKTCNSFSGARRFHIPLQNN